MIKISIQIQPIRFLFIAELGNPSSMPTCISPTNYLQNVPLRNITSPISFTTEVPETSQTHDALRRVNKGETLTWVLKSNYCERGSTWIMLHSQVIFLKNKTKKTIGHTHTEREKERENLKRGRRRGRGQRRQDGMRSEGRPGSAEREVKGEGRRVG